MRKEYIQSITLQVRTDACPLIGAKRNVFEELKIVETNAITNESTFEEIYDAIRDHSLIYGDVYIEVSATSPISASIDGSDI